MLSTERVRFYHWYAIQPLIGIQQARDNQTG